MLNKHLHSLQSRLVIIYQVMVLLKLANQILSIPESQRFAITVFVKGLNKH